jgi:hypothetical protein
MPTSRIKGQGVNVEGLAPLSRALRDLDPEMRKELRDTGKEIAKTEVDHAQTHALSLGGVAAKSAPALKPSAGYNSAGLSITATNGYEFGAFFGGGARPTTQQFKPWIRGGYVPYPTIAADSEDITDTFVDAVNRLIERAFPY